MKPLVISLGGTTLGATTLGGTALDAAAPGGAAPGGAGPGGTVLWLALVVVLVVALGGLVALTVTLLYIGRSVSLSMRELGQLRDVLIQQQATRRGPGSAEAASSASGGSGASGGAESGASGGSGHSGGTGAPGGSGDGRQPPDGTVKDDEP